MSDPKPAQEWTAERVHDLIECSGKTYSEIAATINAAIDAERENSKEWFDKWGDVKAQLAKTERMRCCYSRRPNV